MILTKGIVFNQHMDGLEIKGEVPGAIQASLADADDAQLIVISIGTMAPSRQGTMKLRSPKLPMTAPTPSGSTLTVCLRDEIPRVDTAAH